MAKYVRIKFKSHGAKRAMWYWAKKMRDGLYVRVTRDGETSVEVRCAKGPNGEPVERVEMLVGEPEKELPAKMSNKYAWLEVIDD